MELKAVRYEVDEAVATITLDRPHRLNAWTGRMHEEYRWAVAEAEADDSVGAIVLTGAGRGFCAGADPAAHTDLHRDVGSSVVEADGLLDEMVKDPDFLEGVRALVEKRSPAFR